MTGMPISPTSPDQHLPAIRLQTTMKVSADTFSFTPAPDNPGLSLTGKPVERIYGPLQTTLTLIEDGDQRFCILTTHVFTHLYRYSNVLRPAIAAVLNILPSHVLCFSSHNHCAPLAFNPAHKLAGTSQLHGDQLLSTDDLTPAGQTLLDLACRTASKLPAGLRNATIRSARGHERRISYNRKYHRADGSTCMLREEDRLLLGADFNGDVDDDAFVIGFFDDEEHPISLFASFCAHPATAYNPEYPVFFGEFPQVACDDLSAAYNHVPVGFLQGCCGEINAKGTNGFKPPDQSVTDATRFGHLLGETFIHAAGRQFVRSTRHDAAMALCNIHLPFAGVPPLAELDAQIADIKAFITRCEKNDPDTNICQSQNFPSHMTPKYRATLMKNLLNWAQWARGFHETGRIDLAPKGADLEIAVVRLGDVAIVGLPCEPFDAIGRQIKRASPCPITIPCGYMNDDYIGYIPDSGNNGDLDYQSAYYRYTTCMLPYAQPAGDLLAEQAIQLLRSML
jgi:hypothetical protein